jgi:hypothetical protein
VTVTFFPIFFENGEKRNCHHFAEGITVTILPKAARKRWCNLMQDTESTHQKAHFRPCRSVSQLNSYQ